MSFTLTSNSKYPKVADGVRYLEWKNQLEKEVLNEAFGEGV